MANFPILYTGKDTAYRNDSPIAAQSFAEFTNKYLQAREMKLNKALQDEKFFMQMADMDFGTLIADEASAEMADGVDWFNKR